MLELMLKKVICDNGTGGTHMTLDIPWENSILHNDSLVVTWVLTRNVSNCHHTISVYIYLAITFKITRLWWSTAV